MARSDSGPKKSPEPLLTDTKLKLLQLLDGLPLDETTVPWLIAACQHVPAACLFDFTACICAATLIFFKALDGQSRRFLASLSAKAWRTGSCHGVTRLLADRSALPTILRRGQTAVREVHEIDGKSIHRRPEKCFQFSWSSLRLNCLTDLTSVYATTHSESGSHLEASRFDVQADHWHPLYLQHADSTQQTLQMHPVPKTLSCSSVAQRHCKLDSPSAKPGWRAQKIASKSTRSSCAGAACAVRTRRVEPECFVSCEVFSAGGHIAVAISRLLRPLRTRTKTNSPSTPLQRPTFPHLKSPAEPSPLARSECPSAEGAISENQIPARQQK